MHKASSHKDRKNKLQAQVDKMQKVNSDLEAEIQEHESLAQEIKVMRDNYAKSKSHLFAIGGSVGTEYCSCDCKKENFILTILCFTDVSRRKLQITQHKSKVTPSPLARSNQALSQSLRLGNTTHNPYARSSNSCEMATGSQPSSSNSNTELQTIVMGRPAAATIVHSSPAMTTVTNIATPSLLKRQHPHRTVASSIWLHLGNHRR
jgi:hypothetical protein